MLTMKTCSRCKVEKPLDAFSPDKTRKDGATSWCRPCSTAYARERRATIPEVREKHRLRSAAAERAKSRLAKLHHADYIALLREERELAGIPVKRVRAQA